ncbi:MAG: peptidoglycan DD-metalloendopeptidase family protein [Rhodospirillaceae bacterium]|nr:peptidoglycan DD-metalloendopeptidase family protein [Rhodospirillaceae bacterium]
MQDDDTTAEKTPKRVESRHLLAIGLIVGVSALTLAAAMTAGRSEAGADRGDESTTSLMTPPPMSGNTGSAMTPRTFLYGGSEYLPDPGRHRAAPLKNTRSEPTTPQETRERDLALSVMPGDTLGQILDRNAVSRQDTQDALSALKSVFDPRRLIPGQSVTLSLLSDPDGTVTLNRILIETEPGRRSVATRQENGKFDADEEHDPITVEPQAFSATITSSLFAAGESVGMSPGALQQLIKLYSYDVDFQRDIHEGDSFEVMVDRHVLPDGTVIGDGEIDFATLTLSGVPLRLYRFEDKSGFVDYYNEKGQSVRKALLRTPVDGARISSGYGIRKHPVLGFSKMHKGVDFAAPIGTPVYAAGDGVVERAGPWSTYGNYLRIRHTSSYATAYGHLKGYARDIHSGSRVRQGQVVAYSGNTGRTTGPHLHYEVLVNNHQVNPLKIKMPSGRSLKGEELRLFAKLRKGIDHSFSALASKNKIATATP